MRENCTYQSSRVPTSDRLKTTNVNILTSSNEAKGYNSSSNNNNNYTKKEGKKCGQNSIRKTNQLERKFHLSLFSFETDLNHHFLHQQQKTHISIRPIMIPISSLISRFKFNFWTKNYFISKKRFFCLFCGDKVDDLCSTQSLNLDTIFLFLSLSFYLSFSLSHTFSHLLPSLDIIFRWFDLNLLLQLSTTPPRRLETMTFLSLSLPLPQPPFHPHNHKDYLSHSLSPPVPSFFSCVMF